MIDDAQRQFWDDNGYRIVEGVLDAARLDEAGAAIEARFEQEGPRAGSEGSDTPGLQRLCNLSAKGRPFELLGIEPIALEMARITIGDDFRWQATTTHQAIQAPAAPVAPAGFVPPPPAPPSPPGE